MFGKLFKIAEEVVTLPVSAVADVLTMGGALNDRYEPYTVTKAKRLLKEAEKLAK